MAEAPSLGAGTEQERQPSRLFFSPTVRAVNQESQERAGRLEKTIAGSSMFLERQELADFGELAGDAGYVTLQDFFQAAEEAAQEGNPVKLVALKKFGQSLLEKYNMHSLGKDSRPDQAMDWDFEKSGEDRFNIRAAEMIILKAEIEYLKLRQQEGTFGMIPEDKLKVLQDQFRRYERNADIPEEFKKELRQAAKGWKPLKKAERGVLDETPLAEGTSETVAQKRATEETVVGPTGVPVDIQYDEYEGVPPSVFEGLEEPTPRKRRRYRDLSFEDKKRVRSRYKGAGRLLETYSEGFPNMTGVWEFIEPYLPQAVEWCAARGTLPDTYWITAQMEIKNALQELGLLDNSSTSFTHNQLAQQLQYALHRNQWARLGYWGFWGPIDWFNQVQTKADVAGVGWGGVFQPRKVLGEEAAKALRQVRDAVVQGARRAAEVLANPAQPLSREHQVVKALLELIANELEALSRLEEGKLRKKEEKRAQKKRKKK